MNKSSEDDFPLTCARCGKTMSVSECRFDTPNSQCCDTCRDIEQLEDQMRHAKDMVEKFQTVLFGNNDWRQQQANQWSKLTRIIFFGTIVLAFILGLLNISLIWTIPLCVIGFAVVLIRVNRNFTEIDQISVIDLLIMFILQALYVFVPYGLGHLMGQLA